MTFQQGCFNLQLYFSSRRFGTVAAWRAQRTGYIRRPLATGVTKPRRTNSLNLSSRHPPTRARTLRASTIPHHPLPSLIASSHPFSPQVRLSWLIFAIFVPTCCQQGPIFTPRSPKIAQLLAKMPQDSPKSLQADPPRPENVARTP